LVSYLMVRERNHLFDVGINPLHHLALLRHYRRQLCEDSLEEADMNKSAGTQMRARPILRQTTAH